MATTQITPNSEAEPKVETLETRKQILDLDSATDVELVKSAPRPAPVKSMEDFVTRMGNDAATILKYADVAYLEYFKDTLAQNPDVPWMIADEDADGNETLVEFTGTPINPEKEKGFNATVIQMAKLMYNYAKVMIPDFNPKDPAKVEENRKAKAAAKLQARTDLLSNPVSKERLK